MYWTQCAGICWSMLEMISSLPNGWSNSTPVSDIYFWSKTLPAFLFWSLHLSGFWVFSANFELLIDMQFYFKGNYCVSTWWHPCGSRTRSKTTNRSAVAADDVTVRLPTTINHEVGTYLCTTLASKSGENFFLHEHYFLKAVRGHSWPRQSPKCQPMTRPRLNIQAN